MSSSANIPPYNARNNNTNGNNFNHMNHQQHSAVPQQNHQAMNVPEHLLPQAFMNQDRKSTRLNSSHRL